MASQRYRAAEVGTVLLGAAVGYAAGVVGPPARAIGDDFDVSLTEIGLLTSAFFAGSVVLTLAAPLVERRIGLRRSVQLAPLLLGGGGAVCVLAPDFVVLLCGRAVVGIGTGIALVLAAVLGRAAGGAWLLGIYGGAITVAVAVALALGGALDSAGVDWRANFVVSAAIGFSALPFLVGRFPETPRSRSGAGRELLAEFTKTAYWRVAALFILAAGVPLVVSSWLVHYLTEDDAMGAGAAGAVGFLLFAVATLARPVGGRVSERRHPHLLAAMPFVAALGFALLALDNDPLVAVPAIVVLGLGFSIPYAVSYIRSADLVRGEPTVGLSAELFAVGAFPIAATPALGAALEHGHATAGWLAFAGFSVLAGLVNLPRPPARDPAG
jgi:DHA1 family inner membrane transport protein